MIWIGTGALLIIFFGSRSFINNKMRWNNRKFPFQSSRFVFWMLQFGNIFLIVAGLLFLMLAIVCHFQGYEILFSSEHAYHMQVNDG